MLALAALIVSWRYFTEIRAIFHALMLLFIGVMVELGVYAIARTYLTAFARAAGSA